MKHLKTPKRNILIIDDCAHISSAIAYYLHKAGYATIIANSKSDIQNALHQGNFCAIISDWHISPGYSADDVMSELIATQKQNLPPITIITSDIDICAKDSSEFTYPKMHHNIIHKSHINYSEIIEWLHNEAITP